MAQKIDDVFSILVRLLLRNTLNGFPFDIHMYMRNRLRICIYRTYIRTGVFHARHYFIYLDIWFIIGGILYISSTRFYTIISSATSLLSLMSVALYVVGSSYGWSVRWFFHFYPKNLHTFVAPIGALIDMHAYVGMYCICIVNFQMHTLFWAKLLCELCISQCPYVRLLSLLGLNQRLKVSPDPETVVCSVQAGLFNLLLFLQRHSLYAVRPHQVMRSVVPCN